jgi:hypothetical protein
MVNGWMDGEWMDGWMDRWMVDDGWWMVDERKMSDGWFMDNGEHKVTMEDMPYAPCYS